MHVEQPIPEVPQPADHDLVEQQIPIEQTVAEHTPQEDINATLRKSTRIRKSAIPSDYVVYLQESDYSFGAEDDPQMFSQAMNCSKSELWYNAMKDEMDSMTYNLVWDCCEFFSCTKATTIN